MIFKFDISLLLYLTFSTDVQWCIICIRLFCDAVANFQTGQEEISLIATPVKLTVKNYVEDEPGCKAYLMYR